MDETYIKMCRTAQEIQELWEPKLGDRYCYYNTPSSYVIELVCDEINGRGIDSDGDYLDKDVNAIFLPHQEDLQEIAKKQLNIHISMELFERFMYWLFIFKVELIGELQNEYPPRCEFTYFYSEGWKSYLSITEAWLCFIMETCFGKQWDTAEERWVEL